MPQDKICRTIHQYSSKTIPYEDMCKLQEIAEDYGRVKNYVYQRYGGIRSLPKLYPGYTVQNEMTESGLRAQLQMPSVYFYLAVFDALGDIKSQWTRTKNSVLAAINANEGFCPEEKHYLRFVMKVTGCFDNLLNGREPVIPQVMKGQYEHILLELSQRFPDREPLLTDRKHDRKVDGQQDRKTDSQQDSSLSQAEHLKRLNRYLCRQVRKYHRSLHTDRIDGFAVSERAYRYGKKGEQYGIYLSTKENRKRVFIPLTDENGYKKQLYIKLKPEQGSVEISVPIEVRVKSHEDYTREIGLSAGIWQMFTTDQGKVYGERFGELHRELAEYMRAAGQTYRREHHNNPGRSKYRARKARLDAGLEAYVNQEINRMLAAEKPQIIYLPRLPATSLAGRRQEINYSINVWRKGYIKKRLMQKCKENSIQLVEVMGREISTECSVCGAAGSVQIGRGGYSKGKFCCENCGYEADKKENAARNALRRGREGQQLIIT